MNLLEIKRELNAESNLSDERLKQTEANTACGADLLSDVLAFTKEKTILLTGLIHPQVMRTAEMLDLVGVVIVRGKTPSKEMLDLSQTMDIPLLWTAYPLYEACGRLYSHKLGIRSESL